MARPARARPARRRGSRQSQRHYHLPALGPAHHRRRADVPQHENGVPLHARSARPRDGRRGRGIGAGCRGLFHRGPCCRLARSRPAGPPRLLRTIRALRHQEPAQSPRARARRKSRLTGAGNVRAGHLRPTRSLRRRQRAKGWYIRSGASWADRRANGQSLRRARSRCLRPATRTPRTSHRPRHHPAT